MVTSADCIKKYGQPDPGNSCLTNWKVPEDIRKECKVLPKIMYNVNKDMVTSLAQAFRNLISAGKISEIKVYGGCFCIRAKKGNPTVFSLHSWAIAIDLNMKDNVYKLNREQLIAKGLMPFSEEFINCLRLAGFVAGADWKTPDFMHFELSKL